MADSLYVPDSYRALQARYEAELVEKADVGPGANFGNTVVLGPGGKVDSFLRERGGSRIADKALYKYLYQKHPFVYACVELICQTAAQDRHTYPVEDTPGKDDKKAKKKASPTYGSYAQKALVRRLPNGTLQRKDQREDDGDEGDLGPEPQDGVEFLEHFFAEVNEFESFNELLQAIYRDILIYGEAFVLKQREGATVAKGNLPNLPVGGDSGERSDAFGGRVTHVSQSPTAPIVSLHRIPSRDTFAVAGDDGYPYCYRQKAEGGGYREYAAVDVVFIRLPDPDDPCKGLSPLEALDMSLATDISAGRYNESYFRNGAKAGMVFAAQGLSEHEVRRNKQWLLDEYTKPENAHKPMLLLGNITQVADGKTQTDMDFLNLRKFTREEVCAVYSVPISKLLHESDNMGSTGKMSDDVTFRADTVGPLQTKVYETFNRQMMKLDFPDKPLLIPPRQEKVRLDLLEAAKSLVQVGGTGNEARAILHLPEIEHDTMELPLFLVPGLKALITDDTANQAAQTGEPLAGGHATDANRADRTSGRTSQGQKNARAKSGTGMATRKAENSEEE